MTEPAERVQALGEAGETCRKCAAPLAADQRYCLNCGSRRGGPRVDFHEHLPGDDAVAMNGSAPPAAASVTVPPPADERPQRDYAPLAAVGGIAVLGLMLLVGVLIGKGDSGSSSAPPQVVRVQGGGGGAAASEGAGTEGEGAVKKAKGASKKKAEDAGGLLGGKANGPVQASDDALRELEEQSPDEYSENSAKLPDEIATGGAPPPEDGKAPGGGSEGTAIE